MRRLRGSHVRTARLMLGASALTTLGALPPFLVGAQAVLMLPELGFGARGLGLVVSTFFAVAALSTILGGRWLSRWDPRTGRSVAGALVATGGFAVVFLVHDLGSLVAAMAVLGAGNAVCQGTSNRTVATALPRHRRGLGFGLKQSAVPAAIMLGGLAVPTTTALLGWRSSFVLTGSIGVLVLAASLLGTGEAPRGQSPRERSVVDLAPRLPLLLCGAAILLASAGANFLGAYLSSWAFEVGLTVGQAGLLMAAGSGSSVLTRVVSGMQADRRYGRNMPVVAAMMLVGAASLALIGLLPDVWAVVVFGYIAYAIGWSWPGLLLYAVARLGRDDPTRATSVVQTGAFAGGAIGPFAIGLVVSGAGFQAAWLVAAASFLVAGVLTLLARRGFQRDLQRRPPVEPFGYGGGRERPRHTTRHPPSARAASRPADWSHAAARAGGPRGQPRG